MSNLKKGTVWTHWGTNGQTTKLPPVKAASCKLPWDAVFFFFKSETWDFVKKKSIWGLSSYYLTRFNCQVPESPMGRMTKNATSTASADLLHKDGDQVTWRDNGSCSALLKKRKVELRAKEMSVRARTFLDFGATMAASQKDELKSHCVNQLTCLASPHAAPLAVRHYRPQRELWQGHLLYCSKLSWK